MRTDAKDLALSVFQREKERCDRPHFVEQPKDQASCEDGPTETPDMAAQGSNAMKVYNSELIHRKCLHLLNLTQFVRSLHP